MKAQDIEEILNTLKVNARGSIRGKNKAINALQKLAYKEKDDALMDVRIFVAKVSTSHSTSSALKLIDQCVYRKQQEF